MNSLEHLGRRLNRLFRREDGAAMVELAIVLPVLLLLFVGAVELGRMFYTYTTLAKATKSGARYLSTSRNVTNGTAQQIIDETTKAKNLVVCGIPSISSTGCANQTTIVPGLSTANVSLTLPVAGATVRYVTVRIQNYPYHVGAFNFESRTGLSSGTIYGTAQTPGTLMTPGTTMRYMP